jgi:two-component system OmpR family sensor kinase/two-component system sensor histidine kinase BaeS
MNRLWVRLSIVMSGLILLFTLLPLFAFAILPPRATPLLEQLQPDRPGPARRFRNPWRDVPEDLMRSILTASAVGIAGGVAASRILAAPITKLAKAAGAIGGGDLSARVQIKSGSREIDELAHSFNAMAADLQRAAEVRNHLMADVSHELRTPLTVLEGNLRAALDHVYELDEEQIANLYAQTRHLIQLVNELRELTLAEAYQLPLTKEAFRLSALVEETIAVFAPLAEEKRIALSAQVSPALPSVLADRARIRQVLHNLLANALRHTPDRGTIAIIGRVEEGRVTLAVRDSGDGIEPQHLEHVFERFYRTDPSRSRETGGSGLGLAIVKAIVEAHGGTVQAASAGAGKGSTFTMALPVA